MNVLRVALPNNPANANGGLSETITGTLTKPELLITQSSYRLSKKREGDTYREGDNFRSSANEESKIRLVSSSGIKIFVSNNIFIKGCLYHLAMIASIYLPISQ